MQDPFGYCEAGIKDNFFPFWCFRQITPIWSLRSGTLRRTLRSKADSPGFKRTTSRKLGNSSALDVNSQRLYEFAGTKQGGLFGSLRTPESPL